MKDPKHILVIRLSAMGDVAMTIPVLKKVQEEYPDLKITFLTRKIFVPLFKDLENVEVYQANVQGRHKGVTGLKKLAKELKDLGIDAVADLHDVLRSNVLKVIFRYYGIPVKQIKKGRAEKKALIRKKNKVFKKLKTTHQRYADVFDALRFPVDVSSFEFLSKEQLSPRVRKLTGHEPKKWLGIAPFAKHESKTYPADLMKAVLQKLQEEDHLKIFFFGGGSKEIEILKNWEGEFPNAVSVAGRVSFEEELELISNLDAMVSMDSGNGHLAANYGIPVVSLWGLTNPYAGFAPYGQPKNNSLLPDLKEYPEIPTSVYGTKNPPNYEDAMRTISPDMVVETIERVMNQPPNPRRGG